MWFASPQSSTLSSTDTWQTVSRTRTCGNGLASKECLLCMYSHQGSLFALTSYMNMWFSSFWMKHGICRAEHERARPLFGDLPERFWASRYVNSDAPQIRIKILPRLKKEHRGKALGPSKLRYSYVPEAESTTAFEGTPAKVPCVSTSPSTSLGSVGTVSSRSDDEAYVGQTYVEETNTDKFPYTMANLPEIPDEDDDVQSMRLSAYHPVTYKRDRFYQCSEALRSDTLAAELSMLVCDVAY